jgi:hypothetical protein
VRAVVKQGTGPSRRKLAGAAPRSFLHGSAALRNFRHEEFGNRD